MNRRDFLKKAGSASLFAAMGIQVSACNRSSESEDLPLGIERIGNRYRIDTTVEPFGTLRDDGGWLNIEDIDIIVVNIDGSTIRAFSNVCPHLGCKDAWIYISGQWRCNCHDSRFTNTGQYLQGPANNDLRELTVDRDGNFVIIDKP